MSEMVERVARAINRFPFEAWDEWDGGEGHPHTAHLKYNMAVAMDEARRAIEAMRDYLKENDDGFFPDWDKKLAERFPNGVPVASTPFMEMSKAKRQP